VSLVTNLDEAVTKAKEAGQEYANYAVKLSDASEATRVATTDTRDFTTSMEDAGKAAKKLREEEIARNEAMWGEQWDAYDEDIERKEKAAEKEKKLNTEVMLSATKKYRTDKEMSADAAQTQIANAQMMVSATTSLIAAAFGENKAMQIAAATINTAAAVAAALAFPPGPPATFPVAAAVGIQGAAQIATIASTEIAHSGMSFRPKSPDELTITKSEVGGVLTDRGIRNMGGREAVARANSGQSAGGQLVVVQNRYRHKSFDEFVTDNIARPASLRTAVRQLVDNGGPVGHGSWVKS
jgi:hypothetical protein